MAPSPTIRRLLRETAELSPSAPNPSAAFHAAPVSDADLHEWHFTLLGPPSPSPYAGGLYHGRITLPPQYPLKPPNFRFLTPSARFEVNREICLSISGFHEETWMPAWGVRTALTALRTFMAEPGTAGQVGGLEAPEHVRKRLARESRQWRCGGCEKTNEEVMKEWWAACQEQGVKVGEEGAEVGLEVLPEGMAVEARDVGKGKGKESETPPKAEEPSNAQQQPTVPSIPPPAPQQQPHPPAAPSEPLRPPPPQHHSSAFSPTPTPESTQRAAEARLTASELAPATSSQRPMMNLHAPPLAAASAALEQHAALQTVAERREERNITATAAAGTMTIDRAIAGVFLMLVVMVLKKIFYPASGGVEGAPGGFGEGRSGWGVEREL
ncbi:uncharacterized protein HMPREF1541_03607 [Cyphellophora europaea CBS 101466]|uniref:UBC core domain-containing protein n=1 Tax=Cyphellophora europaea (strain CBS 101466) TaxID=1220924 RepID=W2RYT7_CYPE1|nr:uncharacterized protein HMPREF1541_03607 [Cyphellophora europaea CBS 101466]ETN41671.1 hypothetical protein HMPREF1541_03607 [Cyphellophora europaea CBS 101466]